MRVTATTSQLHSVRIGTGVYWRSLSQDNRWRGIFANTGVVSALTALVKSAGAVKTIFIARIFGTGADLDAYLLAFLIPSFIADVLCGAIVPALVPRLIELLHDNKTTALKETCNAAITRSVALLCAIAAVLAALAGLVIAANEAPPRTALACRLLLVMLPVLPLSALSGVWRASLNANRRFAVAAGASLFTPVFIILSLMIAGRAVWWLAIGTTAGTCAETIALGQALRRLRMPIFSRSSLRWGGEGEIAIREYSSLAVTNLVLGGALFLDQSMAATLGFGAVSVFNYGTRLVPVLIAIGPEALGITLLPRFSQMIVEGGRNPARMMLNKALVVATVAGAIAAGILVWFSGPIVRLVFQHGAFAANDALAVASVQRMSLLQLPFSVGAALVIRFVASARLNRILVPISAAGLVLNAVLNLVLMRLFSVTGIALATTIAQAAVFAMLLLAVARSRSGLPEALAC